MDVTLRSALTRDGEPQPHAADEDGAVLVQARHDKEKTYPELVASERCRLVVIETRGRWSEEAVNVLHQLAVARAREVPVYLSHQVAMAWELRWTRTLASARLRSQHRWWHLPGSGTRGATQPVRRQACVICWLLCLLVDLDVVVSRPWKVPLSTVGEQLLKVPQVARQDRILQQTVEETFVFLVPQTQEQTVEVTSDFPQELMQQRTMEQIDDV